MLYKHLESEGETKQYLMQLVSRQPLIFLRLEREAPLGQSLRARKEPGALGESRLSPVLRSSGRSGHGHTNETQGPIPGLRHKAKQALEEKPHGDRGSSTPTP